MFFWWQRKGTREKTWGRRLNSIGSCTHKLDVQFLFIKKKERENVHAYKSRTVFPVFIKQKNKSESVEMDNNRFLRTKKKRTLFISDYVDEFL